MLTPNAPPDADVGRFCDDVGALIGHGDAARFGVAVSGGPDSVALLLLANAAFAGRVEAATVDHRLRAAGRAEAQGVAELCVQLDVPHVTLTLNPLNKGNISAQARAARYDVLDDWADERELEWLMTGHHADDQLETFVMRLNRGSGVGGLAGVRRRRGRIVRPLLGWRRAELDAIVAACGVSAIDDPSNHDDRYDRARLRKSLAQADWIDPIAVTHSASALADADEALDWVVLGLRAERSSLSDGVLDYDFDGLPREVARRALIDCLRRIAPHYRPRGSTIDSALAKLGQPGHFVLGPVACLTAAGARRFLIAPPRRTG